MSKMRTAIGKGKRRVRIVLTALVLAILMVAGGSMSASAGWWDDMFGGGSGSSKFTPSIAGLNYTTQDATITRSLTDPISFSGQNVFKVGATDFSGVKSFKIKFVGVRVKGQPNTNGASIVADLKQEDSRWSIANDKGNPVFTYKSDGNITYGTFNNLMSAITLTYDADSGVGYGKGSAAISAYSDKNSRRIIRAYSSSGELSSYTCNFRFYAYAKGQVDPTSAKMDYKTQYAASYDSKYASDVPDGRENATPVNPTNLGQGKATFNLYITEGGSTSTEGYGNTAEIGYQIKKAGSGWDAKVQKFYLMNDGTLKAFDGTEAFKSRVKQFNLTTWNKNTPIPLTLTGLDYATTYNVRGIIATDGELASPEYTDAINFTYTRPNINSFNVGSTSQVYKGGEDYRTISMLTTYTDTNAKGTYTDVDGVQRTAPYLRAQVYFTTNRNFTTTANGQVDNSKWYNIGNMTVLQKMENEDGSVKDTFSKTWTNVPVYKTLKQITGKDSDNVPIDSKTCAYKLVVTDMYTGFTSVTYSDPFTVDSTAPSGLTVTAKNAQGGTITLGKSEGRTVGGAGAQVTINLSGATDAGSGLREYSYCLYYLPTEDAVGSSTASILQGMSTLTPSKPGKATYSDWAPAPENASGAGEVIVSKDGYYRIVARAVDNAGRKSPDVEGYFRVDLTAPNKPVVALAKASGSSFAAYDNRTYSQSTVWLFAYSEPMAGKTLSKYEFSTDGGLTWKTVQNTNNANYKSALNSATPPTVSVYPDGQYTGSVAFKYQIGVNMTGLGYSDYQSIMVRATDSLGNVSDPSKAIIMRTNPNTIKVSAALTHDPIEVALALGNTEIDLDSVIPKVKNAAAKKMNARFFGTSSSEYNAIKNHNCTWDSEANYIGPCNQSGCPYKSNSQYYTPEMVNVQGITNVSAQEGITDWKRYDHTNNLSSWGPNSNGRLANVREDGGTGGTESSPGQLVPGGQNGGSTCMDRDYHIIDMSTGSVRYQTILYCGTSSEPVTDWLFLHNDQNLEKVFIFTMDTSMCNFHTYEQSGFWFNTTIRQNRHGAWVLSGYRLVIKLGGGSWYLTDMTGSSQACGVQIQKFTDMDVEDLADSGGMSPGDVLTTASLSGNGAAVQNFMIVTKGTNVTVYKTEGYGNNARKTMEATSPIINYSGCPRPTVDGYTIGDTSNASNPYRGDSDCYGFGPVIGYSSHACTCETRVTFSDISMSMKKGRKLSEVVTEPAWGNGKAKFIANVSDDAQTDFKDPVLTSQIQWRLSTDNAKYIGWGIEANRADTDAFILRMAGNNATDLEKKRIGMYESTSNALATQIDEVATYITTMYYDAMGFNVTDSTPIQSQLSPSGGVQKGKSYDINNIDNITFAVTPAIYNTTSANPDFPAGRWYMTHDTTGYSTAKDPRSGRYSDALETNVTLPGRYTYYFAPDQTKVNLSNEANNRLNPNDAVFDFVVNQKPVADFGVSLSGNTVNVTDYSSDPDGGGTGPGASGTITINGITKREFRWELLSKSGSDLARLYTTNWSTTSPNGKSIYSLTGGYRSSLQSNDVLTIYERVTDVSTKRAWNGSSYYYVPCGNAVSEVCQVNVSSSGVSTVNPPSAAISLSSPYLYDTAQYSSNSKNKQITISRDSVHTQGKAFAMSWAIAIGSTEEKAFTTLTQSGNNYYYKGSLALSCTTSPTSTGYISGVGSGSTGGVWAMPYSFVSTQLASLKDNISKGIVLKLTETLKDSSGNLITDVTARTIYFKTDKNAPSPQVVTSQYMIKSGGSTSYKAYEASNYLDVSSNDKFVNIHVQGSTDEEGALGGYGFYFYKRNGSNVGSEIEWYKLQNYSTGSGTLSGNTGSAAGALMKVTQNSFDIVIGKNAMKSTPNSSLNVAIFAYDKQTGRGGLTGANQTQVTRIEDIKLSTSKPMPPEISVTDSMNNNVAHVVNEGGYSSRGQVQDTPYSAQRFFASTPVTVEFVPQQDRFVKSGDTYVKSSGGTMFYEDIFGHADMTGVANVRYTVKYKAKESESWWNNADYAANNMAAMPVNKVDTSSAKLSFSTDGVYEVTAQIINGSGTVSGTRTVSFTLDQTKPQGLHVTFIDEKGSPYVSGAWAKSVTFIANGAGDLNGGVYEYSVDGGKTWPELKKDANGNEVADIFNKANYSSRGNQILGTLDDSQVQYTFTSGEQTVMVRVRDAAGNVQEVASVNVRVDTAAPVTNPLTLEAVSASTDIFKEYVLSLVSQNEENGRIYAVQGGVTNEKDTSVAVPADADVRVEFHPAAGRELGQVLYNDTEVSHEALSFDTAKGVYYLELKKVRADVVISATFPEEGTPVRTSSLMKMGFYAMRSVASTFSSDKIAAQAEAEPAETEPADTEQAAEPAETAGNGEAVSVAETTETNEITAADESVETAEAEESGEGEADPGVIYASIYTNADSDEVESTVTAGAETAPLGSKVPVIIAPAKNYQVTGITVNGEEIALTDSEGHSVLTDIGSGKFSYDLTVIADPTFINVTFAKIPTRIIKVESDDRACGIVKLNPGDGITALGNDEYRVTVGTTVTIQLNASAHYAPKRLMIDGAVAAEPAGGQENIATLHSYTVEPYDDKGTGNPDEGVVIKAFFGVASSTDACSIEVSAADLPDGKPHGTITPTGSVEIPSSGSRTFTIQPDPGYNVAGVYVEVLNGDRYEKEDYVSRSEYYKVTNEANRTAQLTIDDPANKRSVQVVFERTTYSFTADYNTIGGGVDMVPLTDEFATWNAVPEGVDVEIKLLPKEGYRIASVIITHGQSTYDVGSVNSYLLKGIHGNVRVQATFVQREISHTETTHKIIATAENVHDVDVGLADKAYKYYITDGVHTSSETDWLAKTTIEYNSIIDNGTEYPLEPNRKYTVYVRTRDRVGNLSAWTGNTVYTLANTPGTDGVAAVDDSGNSSTKSVALGVNTNGNPEYTKYLVYYAKDSTMADMKIANESENGGWAQLQDGKFIVKNLEPGNQYWLQVVAENEEGKVVNINPNDFATITLSPTAPPANTLYYEEQASPVGSVKLHWTKPDTEVEMVQIYRDGTFLVELASTELGYEDPEAYRNFADGIVTYSYAYVNEGGAGSSRNAVSKEYHDTMAGGVSVSEEKVQKINNLEATHPDLFTETMVYPAYPLTIDTEKAIRASTPEHGSSNSGKIVATMTYNPSVMMRYQQYELTLRGYKLITDDAGQPILDASNNEQYTEVGIDQWDPDGHYHTVGNTAQTPVTTIVSQEDGVVRARATWEGLSTLYRYKIFVHKILSTGATVYNNLGSAGGQISGEGIEGFLGKYYYVTKTDFGFGYKNDTTSPALETRTGTWAAVNAEAAADSQAALPNQTNYTYGADWDAPINDAYIRFNVSPQVDLANAEDLYSGNEADKIKEDANGKYILVEQNDKKFSIKLAAWDSDGPMEKDVEDDDMPYVKAEIGDVSATVKLHLNERMPVSESLAKQTENLYELTFDVSGLATGVYDKVTLKAYDGVTEYSVDKNIRLIVNRNTPYATVDGGVKRVMEVLTPINRNNLVTMNAQITRSLSSTKKDLARVALLVMPEQYTNTSTGFGSSDYATLKNWLCNGANATALNKAKALLGSNTGSQYVAGNGNLTEDGLTLAILSVAPPVDQYVKITEQQYNALDDAAKAQYGLREEGTGGAVNYWAKLDYALTQNTALCPWLQYNAAGNTVTPPASAIPEGQTNSTYTMKLVTRFGNNTSSQSVDFTVKPQPTARILSDKHFGWTDTHKDEYEAYKAEGIKVQAMLTKFDKCYDHATVTPEYVANPAATDAYRIKTEGGVSTYQVYKLVDDEGEVDKNRINGTVRVDLGINSQFREVGVLATLDPDYNPNNSSIAPKDEPKTYYVIANQNGTKPIKTNNDYVFNATNLEMGETYYLWSFYQIERNGPKTYSKTYVALTTNRAYSSASYGFEALSDSVKEKNYPSDEDGIIAIPLTEWGDDDAYGILNITAEYYQADEHGNILKDSDGNELRLTSSPVDFLGRAKRTAYLSTDSPDSMQMTFTGDSPTTAYVQMKVRNTTEMQGHMVVRLRLTVAEHTSGYCQISKGRETTDVFIQDDESPITSYLLGVENDADGSGEYLMTEVTDVDTGDFRYYEYNLKGLQVGYSEMDDLLVTYKNIGTGDLENITAAVYEDIDGTVLSDAFEAESPSETNLLQSVSGAVGTVRIHPVANLEDKVHEGWVIISADNMEKEDYIKIKIVQVVGQSTLRGRIYITPEREPTQFERTGVAEIYIYDYSKITFNNGVQDKGPAVYYTKTDKYGWYEIPNIINGKKYQIVVKRDGFVTYDSAYYHSTEAILTTIKDSSKTFTFNLCQRGGDIDGNGEINRSDLNELVNRYNMYPADYPDDVYLRRCDINEDSVVNVLDRAYLYNNLGFKGYTYKVLKADTSVIK